MNLAEALTKQYEICVEIAELVYEYKICALTPPEEKPQKDPKEILESLEEKYNELARIEDQINLTNKDHGINELIVKRDQNRRRYRLLNIGYRAAFGRRIFNNDRFRVYKDLGGIREKMNEALAKFRKYDIMIQKLNRGTEFVQREINEKK
jgi:hypothetical protein